MIELLIVIVLVLLLQILGQVTISNLIGFIAFVILGSYCFCSIGILLGFLCRSQAIARTLGLVFYLPLMIPAALSDFSTQMSWLCPFCHLTSSMNLFKSYCLKTKE